MSETTGFRDEALQKILSRMYETGRFTSIVLASDQGLPVAEINTEYDTDAISVLVAFIKDSIERRTKQLDFGDIRVVAMQNEERETLVSYYVEAGDDDVILAAIVPPRTAYRRAMNRAMTAIKKVWRVRSKT